MCLRGFDAGLFEYLVRQSPAVILPTMARNHDRAGMTRSATRSIIRLHQLGPVASAPVAGDAVALGPEQRQRPTVVEDWLPHGAKVGVKAGHLARVGPIGTHLLQTTTKG